MIHIISMTLVAVGLGATLTFTVLYAVLAPTWHHTTMGRVLMGKAVVFSALFALVLLRSIFRSTLPDWIWISGLLSLDTLLWTQVWLLWRANKVKA